MKLFHWHSVETTKELRPSGADDGQHMSKTGAPDIAQGQAGGDPVIPDVEEPLAAGSTSPGDGAHDEGDLEDALGDEGAWAMAGVLVESTGAGAETAGPAARSATQDPLIAMEHAVPKTSSVIEVSPRRSVQA